MACAKTRCIHGTGSRNREFLSWLRKLIKFRIYLVIALPSHIHNTLLDDFIQLLTLPTGPPKSQQPLPNRAMKSRRSMLPSMQIILIAAAAVSATAMNGVAAELSCRINAGNNQVRTISVWSPTTIAARRINRRMGSNCIAPSPPSRNNLHLIRGGGATETPSGHISETSQFLDNITNGQHQQCIPEETMNANASTIINDVTDTSVEPTQAMKTKTLNILHQSSFLMVISMSMVMFSPLPSLTRHFASSTSVGAAAAAAATVTSSSPQARAVKILSILSAVSAAIELFLSPLIGILIDSFGRKRPSILLHVLVTCANLGVVLFPGVWSVCVSRMINVVVGGFLVIVSNAIIADLFATTTDNNNSNGSEDENNYKNSSKNDMGSVLGRHAAFISLGFLFGSIAGGRLTEYGSERAAYSAALLFSVLATLNVALRMMDSLKLMNRRDATFGKWNGDTLRKTFLEAPLSSVQLLFHYGSHMRTLALLLMLQSAPIFMGDVGQVFAREEWGLEPKDFANFVALFGILGIVSNISLPLILQSFGLRNFSLFAIASSLLIPVTILFTDSYRYIILAGCLGLYGGTQKVGTSTVMTSLATESGIPQGQVQGEKASMLALLKISMPLVYSALYLKGKAWSSGSSDGMSNTAAVGLDFLTEKIGRKLPYVLNIVLGICAFGVTWQNL
mmetsp:Transcript_25076/g.45365  ORF Transcript_25076/g.45365 Transcript_25076/m.45365 type:complete len:678 (+) Transcript_25076:80-2113(+)